MKKSVCLALCFAVIVTACAIGLSVFAGTDSLQVVSGPTKRYYLDVNDAVDLTGTVLNVKIDGVEQTFVLDKNIAKSGGLKDVDTTTATEETVTETTTAEEVTESTSDESTSGESTSGETSTETTTETTTKTQEELVAGIKVYYDNLKAGKNKIIFTYGDKYAETFIYVDADPVQSIKVTKAPNKTEYFYYYDDGKAIDYSGLEITVTYKPFGDDEGPQEFVYKYDEIKSLDFMGYKFNIRLAYKHQEGKNPLIVTYLGKEAGFDIYYKKIYPGDVNNDGAVNAADLVRLSRIVINREKLDYNPLTTDLNEDGKINQKDLLKLQELLTLADKSGEFEWVFDAKLLSYMVSADGYFYTADDPWQRNFGFNEVYDYATPYTFMYYDTFRIFFEYGEYEEGELDGVPAGTPKQWMIQPWKGQYGMVLYGAELGVYTKPETRSTVHYDCANDEDCLPMAMTVYKDEKEAFSMPYKKYWWITGFKPGALDNYTDMSKPHSQLTIKFEIDFPANEMAQKFVAGLEERGFSRVGFIDTVSFKNVDVYTIEGNKVVFLWRNVVGTPGQTNVPNSK